MFEFHYSPRHVAFMLTYSWIVPDGRHMYVSMLKDESMDCLEAYARIMDRVDFCMRKKNNCRPLNQKQRYLKLLSNHRRQVKRAKLQQDE